MDSWELTEYEQQRRPQEITMESQMAISLRSLYCDITCPICLDILKQTMTIRECLHRFCSACINKVLEGGNKECPTCRRKLHSRRSLRPDLNFDNLVAQLKEHERPQEQSSRIKEGPECEIILKSFDDQRTRYIKCTHSATVDHLSKYLSMRPDSSKMPELDRDVGYKMYIVANRSESHHERLPGTMNLQEIKDKYKLDPNKPLELFFYIPNQD